MTKKYVWPPGTRLRVKTKFPFLYDGPNQALAGGQVVTVRTQTGPLHHRPIEDMRNWATFTTVVTENCEELIVPTEYLEEMA